MTKEIKVGQMVYYQYIGHRRNQERELQETVVTKVGRKWFEVGLVKYERFDIETLLNGGKGYGSSSRIILSIDDYMSEQDADVLTREIRKFFGGYGRVKATLQQLKEVAKVLNIDPAVPVSDTTEAEG